MARVPNFPYTLVVVLLAALAATSCSRPTAQNSPPAATQSPVPESSAAATPAHRIDLAKLGASCDGTHDDTTAIRAALDQAGTTANGATVVFPPGTCRATLTPGTALTVPSHVLLAGQNSGTTVLLSGAGNGFRSLFRLTGTQSGLVNLTLTRRGSFDCSLVTLATSTGSRLDNVRLEGGATGTAQGSCHGILLDPAGGAISGTRVVSSKFSGLGFGVLLTGPGRFPVTDLSFTNNTFTLNRGDDIELDSPGRVTSQIAITGCEFSDNQYVDPRAMAGFAVGLAHVSRVSITRSSFADYQYNPIHVEDSSSQIRIEGNDFRRSALRDTGFASHIIVLKGSTTVWVLDNRFDLTANTGPVWAVFAGPGGNGLAPPDQIVIRGNTWSPGTHGAFLSDAGATGVRTEANTRK